jgi:hypothetical protein
VNHSAGLVITMGNNNNNSLMINTNNPSEFARYLPI